MAGNISDPQRTTRTDIEVIVRFHDPDPDFVSNEIYVILAPNSVFGVKNGFGRISTSKYTSN